MCLIVTKVPVTLLSLDLLRYHMRGEREAVEKISRRDDVQMRQQQGLQRSRKKNLWPNFPKRRSSQSLNVYHILTLIWFQKFISLRCNYKSHRLIFFSTAELFGQSGREKINKS